MATDAVQLDHLAHHYGQRCAVDDVSLAISEGSFFGVLGPNGGGKTTVFRILSTLLTPTRGTATVFSHDVVRGRAAVRGLIGVVFQSPSLDPYLTVRENLVCAGRLYGLDKAALGAAIDRSLSELEVADRASDLVRALSGGLKRRVEVAKCLLHRPRLLLLDEPSTGLDPSARRALWDLLDSLRRSDGVTVVLTTHDLDEADRCDRIAILDRGRMVAEGRPDDLRARIGGDCITIQCADPAGLATRIRERFGCAAAIVTGALRIEHARGHALAADLADAFRAEIRAVTVARPTLEDVFVHETGRTFDVEIPDPPDGDRPVSPGRHQENSEENAA